MTFTDEIHKKNRDKLTDKEWKILIAEDEISASFYDAVSDLSSKLRRIFNSSARLKEKISTTIPYATLYSRAMLFSAAWLMKVYFNIKDIKLRESYLETSLGRISSDILSICSNMINPQKPDNGLPFSNQDIPRISEFISKAMAQEKDITRQMQLIIYGGLGYIGLSGDYVKLSDSDGVNIYALAAEKLHSSLKEYNTSLVEILNKYKINE